MELSKKYHIHGDNIVECERTLSLISKALKIDASNIEGPFGLSICPSFRFKYNDKIILEFTFLPGYGRWNEDIQLIIRDRGGKLREAADSIITRVDNGNEVPLLAIEYCGALPAGNQAWQRNGRAFSFGEAKIPFFYIAELGGFELASDRSRKAARLPNPAVPFSYLSFSISHSTPIFPIFIKSPGSSRESNAYYNSVFSETELLQIIKAILLDQTFDHFLAELEKKTLSLTVMLASRRRSNDTITTEQWVNAYGAIKQGTKIVEYLSKEAPISWSKTAYIQGLTPTARAFMKHASKYAIGLTSSNLPVCLISSSKRLSFKKGMLALYPKLPKDFCEWLSRNDHLVICWIMGFKPGGDDARPDRGLPPFIRMLIGDQTDMLTVVYGPAPKSTWKTLNENPALLMEQNGLWEAVLVASNAVLIDSITLEDGDPIAHLESHWASSLKTPKAPSFFVNPVPVTVGEQDVDTLIHILFSRLAQSHVFEGLCNPPGGDWSGISVLKNDRKIEYRWLGLPRVTSKGAKRPDHVFQIYDLDTKPIIVVIESKDRALTVEKDIGPRLKKYLTDLIVSTPSIERKYPGGDWIQSTRSFAGNIGEKASVAAFVMKTKSDIDIIKERANVDLIFGVEFSEDKMTSKIWLHPCNDLGKKIATAIKNIPIHDLKIQVNMP